MEGDSVRENFEDDVILSNPICRTLEVRCDCSADFDAGKVTKGEEPARIVL